jgi:anti-sigma factor ChrR (cupin superfamily)
MDQHPDDEELRRYCEGHGTKASIVTIDKHVEECDICYRRVVSIIEELHAVPSKK